KSRPSISPARRMAARLRTWVTRWTLAMRESARDSDQPMSGTLVHSGFAASAIRRTRRDRDTRRVSRKFLQVDLRAKIFNSWLQSLVQGHRRLPAQQLDCKPDIRLPLLGIVLRKWLRCDRQR